MANFNRSRTLRLVDKTPHSLEELLKDEDLDSILSADDIEFASGDEDSSTASSLEAEKAWEQKWSDLQENFYYRDRFMNRMSRAKNKTLMKVIRRREMRVRRLETELLLRLHVPRMRVVNDGESSSGESSSSDSSEDDDKAEDDSTVWYDARAVPDPNVDCPTESTAVCGESVVRDLCDSAMIEWYTTLPCVLSFALHCLLHASIYDVIEIISEECRKYVDSNIQFIRAETLVRYSTFALGLFLMRSSGYLFWWLNDMDFGCIKFDYHNRLRLQHLDARYLLWVKQHTVLQASMFVTGYYLCYKVIYQLYDDAYNCFFGLAREGWDSGEGDDSVSCYGFAYRKLLFNFFHSFWGSLGVTDESSTVLTPVVTGSFCALVCIASICLLKLYGFSVFRKY